MAKNETGIAITIKAWLPTGKTLDEQYAALTVVKTTHESGDYAPLLGAAKIEAVLTDSKTRRVEEVVTTDPASIADEVLGTNITGSNDPINMADVLKGASDRKVA